MHKDKIEKGRAEQIEKLTARTGVNHTATTVLPGVKKDSLAGNMKVSEVKGGINEDGEFVYDTGDIQEIQLSNKKVIGLGTNSQMNDLYNKIKIQDKSVLNESDWYTVENLFFASGSADIVPGSEANLQNLAEIMKAYPDMKVKVGGYTDNTGNEATNQKLSELRAKTAKIKLLEMGISPERVEAEGYGSRYPVCETNDTDECKALNRRIDVRVLEM